MSEEGPFAIPITQERLVVGKKHVETNVRLVKTVETQEQIVDLSHIRDEVVVERVPIGQVVDTLPVVRQEGETTIYPVVEEVVVTERRLILREEVRVTQRRREVSHVEHVPVRTEKLEVQRDTTELPSKTTGS